ncbi:hypothetical protein CASFOL_007538 [Castilleja foliolosa]|uniref:Phytocyanin domain-containing protein n=1 Tax=Castilleja foliolosa TaxID=1961234 RepID=A0ABD3E9I7_9LAMI
MTKVVVAFFVLLIITSPAAAYAVTIHTVGDDNGWNTNVNYTIWATGKTFTTADILVFNYGTSHSVDVVNKDDYTNCTTLNVTSSSTTSPTNITLNTPGPWYFLCPSNNHCSSGQKLEITVAAAGSNPPSSSPPPAGDSVPSTPAATPPTGGSVPSTPADTPPAGPGMPPATTLPSGEANLDGVINSVMIGLMLLVLMLLDL